MSPVQIIGGGLAGAEAAWTASALGVPVTINEMRPLTMTAAHVTGDLAELVCSNSLKGEGLTTASGLLKGELRLLGSLVMACAARTQVPAGRALAVDRRRFAALVTAELQNRPGVEIIRREVTELGAGTTVVATGPLTSPALAGHLASVLGQEHLAFYDASAPIVVGSSLDRSRMFAASRYGDGDGDYLNCPLSADEYRRLRAELMAAERHVPHATGPCPFFEGCLPVEELARRGEDVLRYGPLKPVGLRHPATGRIPYAVVQLRAEQTAGELYNLVGFQTSLRHPEQKRVFRLIPGLEKAEFARYGAMQRNTYLDSPRLLGPDLALRTRLDLFFAGQLIGVEGYVESAAAGLVAGLNAARRELGLPALTPPLETLTGALCRYVSQPGPGRFQPMNASFGLLPPGRGANRQKRRAQQVTRALDSMAAWAQDVLRILN